jgi:hypothetical protein
MITCFLRWFKTFYIFFLSTRISTPFINTLVLFNYQIRLSGGYKQNDKDDLDTRHTTDHKIKKNKVKLMNGVGGMAYGVQRSFQQCFS